VPNTCIFQFIFIHTSPSLRAKKNIFQQNLIKYVPYSVNILSGHSESSFIIQSFVRKPKIDLYSNMLHRSLPSLPHLSFFIIICVSYSMPFSVRSRKCDVTHSVKLLHPRVLLGLQCGLYEPIVLSLVFESRSVLTYIEYTNVSVYITTIYFIYSYFKIVYC